ncbi:MAG: SLC13 family permease [Planctomycetaceae bacterium]|nr:SLC13 family permease [Planctomycetaceae bacterium]
MTILSTMFSWQATLTIVVTVLIFVFLQIQKKASTDVLFLCGLLFVTACGILTPAQAFSGFSNVAILTIAGLLAITAGLRITGVLDWAGHKLLGTATTEKQAIFRLSAVTTVASAFLLNTAVVAMMMPVVVSWCRRRGISPSRLLMPVSYLAILGGICTLIGTSTTLVVNGELQYLAGEGVSLAKGVQPLSMFELTVIGLPCAVIGVVYMLTIMPKLLPQRTGIIKQLGQQRREYLVEMHVDDDCPLINKSIEEAGLRHLEGLFLIEIDRDDHIITPVAPDNILRRGDQLIFTGAIETIVELERFPGLSPSTELSPEQHPQRHLTEVVLSRKSPLLSPTVRAAKFRQRYDAAVVAIHRAGERLTGKVGDTTLEAGDTLLLQTGTDFLQTHQHNPDFYMVSSVQGSEPRQNDKAKTASLLLIALLLWLVAASIFGPASANSSLLGLASPAVAALTIAVLMVLTRCLKMSDARASINLQMLITIGAALGLGKALKESGAATEIANSIFTLAGNHPWTILIALYILTVVLTETISNNAVAAMLLPLAIEIAATGDWNARPFIFTVTIAASLSFVTPIGYQTNLMVMGPGGYRANDYFRCGLPLAILMGICALTLIPIVAKF